MFSLLRHASDLQLKPAPAPGFMRPGRYASFQRLQSAQRLLGYMDEQTCMRYLEVFVALYSIFILYIYFPRSYTAIYMRVQQFSVLVQNF